MDHPWSPPESRPELLFRVHSKASRTHQRPRIGFAATDEKKVYPATDLAAFCQSIIDHRTQAPKKSPYISLFEDFAEADMWAVALEDVTGLPTSIYAIDIFHPSLQSAFIFKVSHIEQKRKIRLGNGAESEWMVCHRLATAAIIESMTRTSTEVRLDYGLLGPSPPFYTHRDAPPTFRAPLGPNKITMQSKNLLPCGCIHEDFCRHFQWPGATHDWIADQGQLAQRPPELACNKPFRKNPNCRVQQGENQSHQARKSNMPHYGPFPSSVRSFEKLAKTRVQCDPQITTSSPNTAPKVAQVTKPNPNTTPKSEAPRGVCASNEIFRSGQNGTPPRKEVLFPGRGRTSPSQPVFLVTTLHSYNSFNNTQGLIVGGAVTSSKRKRPNEDFSVSNGSGVVDMTSKNAHTPLPETPTSKTCGLSVLDGTYSQFGKPLNLNLHISLSKSRQNTTQNGSQASMAKSASLRSVETAPISQPLSEGSSRKASAASQLASKPTLLLLNTDTIDAYLPLSLVQPVVPHSRFLGVLDQLHHPHSIYSTHEASHENFNQIPNNLIDPQPQITTPQVSKYAPALSLNLRQFASATSWQTNSQPDNLLFPPPTLSALFSSSLIPPQTRTHPYSNSTELDRLSASPSAPSSSIQDPRILTSSKSEIIIPPKVLSPSKVPTYSKTLSSIVVEDEDIEMADSAAQ